MTLMTRADSCDLHLTRSSTLRHHLYSAKAERMGITMGHMRKSARTVLCKRCSLLRNLLLPFSQ